MEEKEMLEVDIEDLKNACNNIIQAMNNLKDILDGLDEEYVQLEQILDSINDLIGQKENRLERLQEIEEEPDTKYQQYLAEMSDKIYEDSLNED